MRCAGYIHSLKRKASSGPRAARRPGARRGSRRCEARARREAAGAAGGAGSRRAPRGSPLARAGSSGRTRRARAAPRRPRHPRERAADVVPDPCARVRERRDVNDDSHGERAYVKESKCAPGGRGRPCSLRCAFAGIARWVRPRKSDDAASRRPAVSGTRSVPPIDRRGTEIRADRPARRPWRVTSVSSLRRRGSGPCGAPRSSSPPRQRRRFQRNAPARTTCRSGRCPSDVVVEESGPSQAPERRSRVARPRATISPSGLDRAVEQRVRSVDRSSRSRVRSVPSAGSSVTAVSAEAARGRSRPCSRRRRPRG